MVARNRDMGTIGVILGLVATVQGTAWLGGSDRSRTRRGAVLAPLGLSLVAVSLLHLLVPTFFD